MGNFSKLKAKLRRLILPSRLMPELDALRLNQGRILSALNRGGADSFEQCEFSVASQFGEDGIIQKLIQQVPIAHRTFIEFGVEDFSEANCRFLMMNNNWRGYVLDSSVAQIAKLKEAGWWWRYDLRATCATVTRDNLNDVLRVSGFDADLGILSIDVDGVDYWLLDALTAYSPRILIIEYNSLFGAERKISVPYDAAFSRRERHYSGLYFGASLAALTQLAARKGYALVCTESAGVNAFFVRNDVLGTLTARTAREAYVESKVRQSFDEHGHRDYRARDDAIALIRGLPVVNVDTGELEVL